MYSVHIIQCDVHVALVNFTSIFMKFSGFVCTLYILAHETMLKAMKIFLCCCMDFGY